FYVHRILANVLINFRFETWRMREVVLSRIRSEKTSNADAIDPSWGIIRRHAYNDRPFPFPSQVVPDSERLDRGGVRETQFVVGMINPIAKAIHTQRTGVLAGTHAHPSGNGYRRNHAFQAAVNSAS